MSMVNILINLLMMIAASVVSSLIIENFIK